MEIEIKLTYNNKPKIVSFLKSSGFKLIKTKTISDLYFGTEDGTMSNKNKLFRIRDVDGKIELTLKDGLEDSNGIWTRREINVGIDNLEGIKLILESLNCRFIKENKSQREIWRKGETSFDFISFTSPAALDLIEIEAEDAQTIESIVSDLGDLVSKAGEDLFKVFDKK